MGKEDFLQIKYGDFEGAEKDNMIIMDILNNFQYGIVICNSDKNILFYNKKAVDLMGGGNMTEDEYFEYIGFDEFVNADCSALRKNIKGKDLFLYNFSMNKDNKKFIMTVIKDEELFSDETKILNKVGEMALFVGHEIKNSLTGLEGYFSLLERKINLNDPEIRRLVDKVNKAIDRQKRVLANTLSFAKKNIQKETESIILNEVIDQLVRILKEEMRIKGQEIDVWVPVDIVLSYVQGGFISNNNKSCF